MTSLEVSGTDDKSIHSWSEIENEDDLDNRPDDDDDEPVDPDIAYWEMLQARARRKAARDLEKSTALEHDLDHLNTLNTAGGYVSRHNPPSYFDELKERKAYVPGVGTYGSNGVKGHRSASAPAHRSTASYGNTSGKGMLRNGTASRDLWGAEERRAKAVPGVGRYNHAQSSLSQRSLPLARSRASSAGLARLKHQQSVPGPGRYFISGDISSVKIGPVLSSATRGKNEFDLAIERSLELPAPDTYTLPQMGAGIKGGVISTAVPPRSMDLAEAHAKKSPGPGHYTPKQGGVGVGIGGGKISEAKPQSDVDVMQRRAKDIPGPGHYQLPASLRNNGGVVSESKIPELFKDDLRKAREGPSPGTYADGLLKTSLSPTGGALSRARLKRYYEEEIERSRAVPGPGGSSKVGSTLNRSGGIISTARPKSDVEWRIHRAKQLPGPKYTITNPDTQRMEKVLKDAQEMYRREHGGEDPYKARVAARTAGVPAHERLYEQAAPQRREAKKKRALRSASAARRYENRAKLYAYSDKYRHETIAKTKERYGNETAMLLLLEDDDAMVDEATRRRYVRPQNSNYLLLRDPVEDHAGENALVERSMPVDDQGNNAGLEHMLVVAHGLESQGRLLDAVEVYTAALEMAPIITSTKEKILLSRAVALSNLRKPKTALQSVIKCLDVNPRNTKAWYRKGLLLQELGRTDEAQECFDRMSSISLGAD